MTTSGALRLPLRRYKGPTLLPPNVTDTAIDALETFEYREGDVLIAAFPKAGTHWINEVIQLILHDGDPTKLDHRHRRVCIELKDVQDFSRLDEVKPTVELVQTDPSPRVLMTHLGPSYLSKETWTKRVPTFTRKVVKGQRACTIWFHPEMTYIVTETNSLEIVFILRDPRDAVLSLFNFAKDFKSLDGKPLLEGQNFDLLLEEFMGDDAPYGNWCDHALEYERFAAKGENILFVTYEDMKKDMAAVVKSIANHIGHDVTDEVIGKVVTNSTVDAMRRNYTEASNTRDNVNTNLAIFIKTGVAGKWKTEVPENKWKKLNETFKERVKDTVFAKRYFQD